MVRFFAYPVICLGLALSPQAVSFGSGEIAKPQGPGSYTDRGEMDAFLSRLAELCYRKGKLVPLNPEIAQRLRIPPDHEVFASTFEGDDGALHSIEEYREYDDGLKPQKIFFGVNDGKSLIVYLTDIRDRARPLLVIKATNNKGGWTWNLIPPGQVKDQYNMELTYWETHQQTLIEEPDRR